MDTDAIAPYKKLRYPLLITYSKLDYTVPVEENARLITAVLKESGHKDYSIPVIESAGHGFARVQESQPMLRVEPFQFVREYFSVHEDWLRSHGFCK
jgi:dipeptidyl aminopeptidase/acylaminoacyl peptidase